MSTWVTDARALASAHESKVPEEARRAELVRQIVEAATSRRAEGSWCSAARCIARASRKACSGRILVAQTEAGRVDWSCTACGERGVITGFEGTQIDLSSYVPREKKLRIWGFDDEERSALLAGTAHIPSLRAVVARASPAAEIKGLLQRHEGERVAGARPVDLPTLMREADIVIATTGRPRLIDPTMVRPGQVLFPLSNPYPEIDPGEAMAAGAAFATDGRTINNALAYPGLFRGALDVRSGARSRAR